MKFGRWVVGPRARRTAALAVGFALLLAVPAGAQQAAAAGLLPPELIDAPAAEYPASARAERLNAVVVLRLTIDVDGRVIESEVVEPAGHGFDEAARTASFSFRFKPALRNGEPIQARIRYPVEFQYSAPVADGAQPSSEPSRAQTPAPLVAPVPEPTPVEPASSGVESSPASSTPAALDVEVRGRKSDVQRLQESAEAVNVVDTRRARQETADLGEVLARTQGIAIRRDGGLGSETRFSLNGLYDDQIRFFVDGMPLDFAGYPFGIENVPVNLTERVEIYRGVVPVRLGADALGGAVNIVSDPSAGSRATASYQTGSFGLHRVTATGRYHHVESGFVAALTSFVDVTQNNYDVDVEVTDSRGRLSPATVPRFHDAYNAYGVTLEAGLVDQPWANRLSLKGFFSGYHKEVQHNLVMSVPYGEVNYGERVGGLTARYDVDLSRDVNLELIANYSHRTIDFDDHSRWVYNWYGQRIRERRHAVGEVDSTPDDQTEWQEAVFARASLQWTIAPQHILRASISPTFATRTGDERIQVDPNARDPLSAQREQLTMVSGVEYELNAFNERLSNIFFVKDYIYETNSEEPLPGNIYRQRDRSEHRQGIGNSVRFRFTPWLMAKASYEYATRLPRPVELFGNGILIKPNLQLAPEISHNANFGPRLELHSRRFGDLVLDVNAFLRDSDQLIVLLGNDRDFSYQNVYRARALGVENAVSWQTRDRLIAVDGTLTWQDVRNASKEGTFRDFEGDRIPNRPYLFASFGGRLRFKHLPDPEDTIEPFYHGRYVHDFFRGWESIGRRDSKQVIDSQLTHDAGVTYSVNRDLARVYATFEVSNFTDAKVFDNYDLQRPGRAFYIKVSGEI